MPGVPLDTFSNLKKSLKSIFRKKSKPTDVNAKPAAADDTDDNTNPTVITEDADPTSTAPAAAAQPAPTSIGTDAEIAKTQDHPVELPAASSDPTTTTAKAPPQLIITPASVDESHAGLAQTLKDEENSSALPHTSIADAGDEPSSPKPIMSATSGPLEDQPHLY